MLNGCCCDELLIEDACVCHSAVHMHVYDTLYHVCVCMLLTEMQPRCDMCTVHDTLHHACVCVGGGLHDWRLRRGTARSSMSEPPPPPHEKGKRRRRHVDDYAVSEAYMAHEHAQERSVG